MKFITQLHLKDIKPLYIFDNEDNLSEKDKKNIKFQIYLDGQKSSRLGSYEDFIQFLELYNIDKFSQTAAMAEMSFPIKTPEGTARFVRVSPSDKKVMMATGATKMFNQIKRQLTEKLVTGQPIIKTIGDDEGYRYFQAVVLETDEKTL